LYVRNLWDAKRSRQGYNSDGFKSFAFETIEGLRLLFKLPFVIAYFLKADRKMILAWLPLSTRILVTSHLSI
jgi:hypothetical protein